MTIMVHRVFALADLPKNVMVSVGPDTAIPHYGGGLAAGRFPGRTLEIIARGSEGHVMVRLFTQEQRRRFAAMLELLRK